MKVTAEEYTDGVTIEISEDAAEEYGNEMGKVMTIFRRIALKYCQKIPIYIIRR